MFNILGFIKDHLFSILFCLVISSLLVSCGKDEEDNVSPTTPPEATNLSPEISAQSFEVPESITDTDVIGIVVASDPEKGSLEFSIIENIDNLFEITKEGELSLSSGIRLDFEAVVQHEITVTVSDGDLEASAQVTIDVTDVDETLNYFITTWQTDGPNQEITIPVNDEKGDLTYNYSVDWGDGSTSSNQIGDATHSYAEYGTYTVIIDGLFPAIYFDNNDLYNPLKIRTVEQWGSTKWKTMKNAFYRCQNLTLNAEDDPDLSQVTDMTNMFKSAYKMNEDIGDWDVSNVINMSGLFDHAYAFNQDISSWDVSNVTNMSLMFKTATSFNQDLNNWDVSSVTDMSYMFSNATEFNSNIGDWAVSSVINMESMFTNNSVFNQDLSGWDVSKVVNMSYMFYLARAFNQDISGWEVSSVTDMSNMFRQAFAFNQDIGNWDVSKVTDMGDMLYETIVFDQDLSNWDVSSVNDMGGMFSRASLFNSDISNWDVSNTGRLSAMFADASSFNQSLGKWNLNPSISANRMLDGTALSTENYDDTLIGWSQLADIPTNLYFGAIGLTYCNEGEVARNILVSNGWTISGDSKSSDCP